MGSDGAVVGITCFMSRAPGDVLFKHFGFTVDHVDAEGRVEVRNDGEELAKASTPPKTSTGEVSESGRGAF